MGAPVGVVFYFAPVFPENPPSAREDAGGRLDETSANHEVLANPRRGFGYTGKRMGGGNIASIFFPALPDSKPDNVVICIHSHEPCGDVNTIRSCLHQPDPS